MKIYTKTGDKGETSLLGGTRVPKYHLRIESYGTVDELNAHIGMIRDMETPDKVKEMLLEIQDRLFTIGSELASEPGEKKFPIPHLEEKDIQYLEDRIDEMNDDLPPMRSFVLPGGHTVVSQCHVARCVCRRAERIITHLASESEVPEIIPIYLNRLSDFLFVLSRWMTKNLGALEMPWKPRK